MDQNESLQLPLLATRSTTKETKFTYYNNIAILISTTSFFYNILEGAVSVYFGEVSDSISLFFFGVQSFVEVLSSIIVLWKVMTAHAEDKGQIKIEKRATIFIGCLFIFLAIGILITGVLNLVNHSYPTTTIPNIIVSGVATSCMLVLYTFKKKLAKELNSSTIQSDAQCSLACIKITVFLLIGSTIFHFWNGGWWIDGAMALILGILFGKEGVQMLRWASSKDFNGGCCGGCAKMPENPKLSTIKVVCSTTLPSQEQQYVQEAEPIVPKKADGCCKAGKCSSKTPQTQIVQNEVITENFVEKDQNVVEIAVPEVSSNGVAKKCCGKGKACSKTAGKQEPAPIEIVPEIIPEIVTEIVPETSLHQTNIVMTKDLESPFTEQPIIQKPADKCCKKGKCSKPAQI